MSGPGRVQQATSLRPMDRWPPHGAIHLDVVERPPNSATSDAGSLETGKRPYINLLGARYGSAVRAL